MNVINKIPGPLLIFMGALCLSFGGLIVKKFEGSVLMVTHDEDFIKQIANKLIIFDQGKVFMFHGNYEDFTKKIGWKESEYDQIY